jgi:putative endonuclease
MKVFTSATQKVGKIGENVARRFYEKQGFALIVENYTKKWGEIDLVMRKGALIHFIEVKSQIVEDVALVNHSYRPEENVHFAKVKRLRRVVETFILQNEAIFNECEWQFDVACVFIQKDLTTARVKVLENVIL